MSMELQTRRSVSEPEDLSKFDFLNFAETKFQNGEACKFARAPLSAPLLSCDNDDDRMASCAISVAILRFMRDMPEPKVIEEANQNSGESEMNISNMKAYSSGSTFKRKIISEKANLSASMMSHNVPSLSLMNQPTTNLEKIWFITSFGIRRSSLRDEIYCQICRQLINNLSQTSYSRGWILLALCIGVFPPSDELLNYIRSFLKQGPGDSGEYCYKILRRTLQIDCRRQPPSAVELEAVKTQSQPIIPVTFMDGSIKKLEVDPATTCKELCKLIKKEIGMKSIFGFSIYIAALEQVANWGCGSESVLDAASLAEQYARTKDRDDPDVWGFYLRKDLFEPVIKPNNDKVATNLIYHQIIGGILTGEYVCSQEEDLFDIIAKRYYIENGPEMEEDVLRKLIKESVPQFVLDSKKGDELFNKVIESFYKSPRVNERADGEFVKHDIVMYAAANWFNEFSRMFDGFVSSGPKLPKIAVNLAINLSGLLVLPKEDIKAPPVLGLDFSQMNKVESVRKGMYLDPVLAVTTNRSVYSFRSQQADTITDLLNHLRTLDSNGTVDSDAP